MLQDVFVVIQPMLITCSLVKHVYAKEEFRTKQNIKQSTGTNLLQKVYVARVLK